MPLLSLLTAACGGRAELLAETGESVAAQELPAGWRLEWVVQEDGEAPELERVVKQFPFAAYEAHAEQVGIASTRNLALTRVDGELVHVLDSGDLLLPGALAVAIRAFDGHPDVHWVAAQADNLLPDGTRCPINPEFPTGYTSAGTLTALVDVNGEISAGMTFRTDVVRAFGGWAANPGAPDSALMAAVAELTAGYVTPEVTWLRRWNPAHTAPRAESVDIVRQRLAALRALRLTTRPA